MDSYFIMIFCYILFFLFQDLNIIILLGTYKTDYVGPDICNFVLFFKSKFTNLPDYSYWDWYTVISQTQYEMGMSGFSKNDIGIYVFYCFNGLTFNVVGK